MRIGSQKDYGTWASFKNVDVHIDQRKKILSDININFSYGENTVILGPNGSGKSTFLKLLNRSIYPTNSLDCTLKLFNKENINIWDLRRKIGFLFKEMEERVKDSVSLYDLITSGFAGTFNARYSNLMTKKDVKKVESLIIDWELENIINKEFITLSDGQRRRALLARSMVYQPRLLVLDEPFCNLDIKSNFILNRNLNKLIDKSVNIIYVTHNLESILAKTNRVILIKEGRIINDGSPNQILRSEILSDLFQISIDVIKQDDLWRIIPKTN